MLLYTVGTSNLKVVSSFSYTLFVLLLKAERKLSLHNRSWKYIPLRYLRIIVIYRILCITLLSFSHRISSFMPSKSASSNPWINRNYRCKIILAYFEPFKIVIRRGPKIIMNIAICRLWLVNWEVNGQTSLQHVNILIVDRHQTLAMVDMLY